MGHRNDCAVGIEIHRHHHVVGHAAIKNGAFHVPRIGILLAWIADRDAVIERLGHLRQILRKLSRADDQQAPARPMYRREPLAIKTKRAVRPACRVQCHLTALHIQRPGREFMAIDTLEQFRKAALVAHRFQHQFQLAAAGQAVARGFVLADPIRGYLWLVDRQRLVANAQD